MLPQFTPPALDKEWATTYLQILTTSFVFALGVVPTLAASIIVPEDLRHVAHQLRFKRWVFAVVAVFIVSLLLIWAAPSLLLDETTAAGYGPALSYSALVIVMSTPILAASLGPLIFYGFRRSRIVPRLEKELTKFFDRKGYLDGGMLGDLIYLGEQGRPGAEKESILNTLERLARHVLDSSAYRDHVLEDLIRSLETVVAGKGHPGDDRNFQRAAEILKTLWHPLNAPDRENPKDAASVYITFQRLAVASPMTDSDSIVLVFLESAASYSSDIIFAMGVSALTSAKYFAATMALNKLEALADESQKTLRNARSELSQFLQRGRQDSRGEDKARRREGAILRRSLEEREAACQEISANLLGLISHFAVGGPSTEKRAKLSLDQHRETFLPNFETSVVKAFEYHFNNNAYKTSDLLAQFTLQS